MCESRSRLDEDLHAIVSNQPSARPHRAIAELRAHDSIKIATQKTFS
ncbi:hypothetical protein [Amycolatopsis orientalis]|nr:hypothetical protein [Amycolatopsis orientalis]